MPRASIGKRERQYEHTREGLLELVARTLDLK